MFLLKRFFVIPVLVAVALFSCQCNPDDPEPEIPVDPEAVHIAEGGETAYSIAYAGSLTNAKGLQTALLGFAGVSPNIYRATEKTTSREILLGFTSRSETKEALSELGGEKGYIIRPVGEKLVIAGSNDTWTAMALHAFQKTVLGNGKYLSDGSLIIPKSLSLKQSYKDPQLIARLLQGGYTFDLQATPVLSCTGESGMTVAQGAASDGTCFYFVNRTSDDKSSIVYKYDMATSHMVSKSVVFYAGHCNDMTYDSVNKRLIIAHGQSEGKILTPVDAETLTPAANVNISVGSGAITFNSSKGNYAISQGGSTFYVTDGSFKVVLNKKRTDSTGYTAQGMGSDDYYVYFPMSGSKDNVLVVYNWNGVFVRTLTVPVSLESESMFYAAGNYYVNFYAGSGKGASLYRIEPLMTYKY